jgi:hypothetical protein
VANELSGLLAARARGRAPELPQRLANARAFSPPLPEEVPADSSHEEFSQGGREVGPCRTLKERFFSGQAVSREYRGVRQVLFAPGHILRDREIVDFQALALDSAGVRILQANQPLLPAARQRCGGLTDALLPITTICKSSAIAPAARITCSRSERFTDPPPRRWVQQYR